MKTWTLRFRQVDRDNFEEVRRGEKSIETRAASVKYQPIKEGDTLRFVCGTDSFEKHITRRYHWPSIDAMLEEVPLKRVMPSVASEAEMRAAYASYLGYEQKIRDFGLLGFELSD